MKINFVKSDQRLLKWTQIEKRDGLLYMRMKQRSHLLDDAAYYRMKGIEFEQ